MTKSLQLAVLNLFVILTLGRRSVFCTNVLAKPALLARRQPTTLSASTTSTSTAYHVLGGNVDSKPSRRRGGSVLCSDVQLCSSPGAISSGRSIPATVLRGAFLRIASDLLGGTAFENIKCQVALSRKTAIQAVSDTVSNGGISALWTGTPSRTVEGALVGAVFMLSSTLTKAQMKALGAGPTSTALAAGLIGGVAQALIMTPAGMVFTSLNVNRGKSGHEKDTAYSVASKIIREKGFMGMYYGFKPMCIRQASNWASRAWLTEIARSVLGLQQYGLLGEIGSGVLGGLGSCWNTPIETIRVLTQRDLSIGAPVQTMGGYWYQVVEADGYPGLFRGITPRALQAIWQTCFLVVVPNLMGI